MYVCVYVCMCVCVYVCMCVYIYIYITVIISLCVCLFNMCHILFNIETGKGNPREAETLRSVLILPVSLNKQQRACNILRIFISTLKLTR